LWLGSDFFPSKAKKRNELPGRQASIDARRCMLSSVVFKVMRAFWRELRTTFDQAHGNGIPVLASDRGALHDAVGDARLECTIRRPLHAQKRRCSDGQGGCS
jgi:hypothetical protein